ncbi:MAG: hypothetical protein U0S36_13810 [Candidatus Nanopelagicales bacterium]
MAAERIREVVGLSLLASAAVVGAPCTWVLSNHDVWRPVTWSAPHLRDGTLTSPRPCRRSRSLVSLGLPGSAYLYQGEELRRPRCSTSPTATARTRHSSARRARTRP